MLKIFRHKNVAKFVLWALLILILPAFVMWGAGGAGKSGQKGPTYVGTIGAKQVSFEDFAKSLASVRCQVVFNYYNQPEALQSYLNNKPFMGKLAWDRLVLVDQAKRAHVNVGDKEVVKLITTHPLFIRDGKFDDRTYAYFLSNILGLYPRNFEELTRDNLMIQKLTDIVTKDVKITDEEIRRNYERDNSKFRISYTIVQIAQFTNKVNVSEDEIKEFYEKHKKEFVVRPKDAKGKEMAEKALSLGEMKDKIKSFLTENKARPIASTSADQTYSRLKESMGKDKLSFEAAASKLGLKTQASQLFTKNDYIEGVGDGAPIAAAAAKLKSGEISKVLGTKKGFLIFGVTEITPFDKDLFEKEKTDYSKKALNEKIAASMEDWLREREKNAKLNIDLNDYDKYYK